jgi:hypothetical protein
MSDFDRRVEALEKKSKQQDQTNDNGKLKNIIIDLRS